MNRVVFLSAMAVLVVGLLVASAPATTISDNFGTSHDYLGGVTGTIGTHDERRQRHDVQRQHGQRRPAYRDP